MPNYKKMYIEPKKTLPKELMEKVIKYNDNTLEVVLERISCGLVGELLIEDNINYPFIKKKDIVILKESSNIRIKDFILYKYKDKYYLRRVLKIIDQEIYVAGDNEREYHITKKDDIVAKGISSIRNNKYKSFNLKRKNRLYLFFKYNLQALRFSNRIIRPENEEVNEALTQALKANLTRNVFVNKTIESKISDELDRELMNFIDPDTLVLELEEELSSQNTTVEETDEEIKEVIIEIPEEVEDDISLKGIETVGIDNNSNDIAKEDKTQYEDIEDSESIKK